MGLAASQARLLTITSRMSNNELRQQRIAMDKMRLASDSDNVSQKYSEALNNQTLKFNDKAFTYDDLIAAGYSVMRASDGVIAGGGNSATENNNTVNNNTNNNTSDPEIQKWIGQPAPTKPTFNEVVPTAPTEKLEKPVAPTNSSRTISVPDFNQTISFAQQLSNTSYNYTHSWDGYNTEQRQSQFTKNALDNSLQGLLNSLHAQTLSNTATTLKEAQSNAQQTYDRAPKNLDTGRTGDYGQSSFGSFGKTKTAENEYGTTMLSALKTAQSSANTEAESIRQSNLTAQNNYNTELDKYNKNQQEWNTYNTKKAEYDSKYQNYINQLSQYNTDYRNWTIANSPADGNNANNSTATGSGTTTSSASPKSQELASQISSSNEFLIQGLLSGYFVLMKDGKQVSLTSDTKFTTEYDKSDDAAAEAEYNSQMAKINRKEKLLDNQAKRLDTEYNALSTELQSIQGIIQTHASKDFELFS